MSQERKNLLEIEHLSFSYPSLRRKDLALPVLRDLSLVFNPSEIVAILGPSGNGKSTLLNLIAGILKPNDGTIIHPHGSAFVGYVLQSSTLIPWKSVWENALYGVKISGNEVAASRNEATKLLERYGLIEFRNKYPSEISGGMRQRLSLIRAAISGARVMLLDEPFSQSDFLLRSKLQSDVSELVSAKELIAVLVTHDVDDAVRMGDRVVMLSPRPGRIIGEISISIDRAARLSRNAETDRKLVEYKREIWSHFEMTEAQREINQ